MAILDQHGNPFASPQANPVALSFGNNHRRLRASYDAAQTTDDNSRHWANSDALSADAAHSPGVRTKLRNRSRYEAANNSYCRGIVNTLANDTIGTGPRLQIQTGDGNADRRIERSFAMWAKRAKLAAKLRTMRIARAVDGECFAQFVTNRRLNHPVSLDLRLTEADQIATPDLDYFEPHAVDGIEYDENGNPTVYHRLRWHPGSETTGYGENLDKDDIRAEDMVHLFRLDRPGQHRGVPEITPALPLFAQLRRYTLATIAAAETAAEFAGVMYTDSPPDDEPDAVGTYDAIEMEIRSMLTLPAGWKMSQVKAEQPASTYAEFKREIVREIARCINMPYNVAAGDSSDYNYASGRLDHQTYFKAIDVDRSFFEIDCLDVILARWLDEAVLIPDLLSAGLPPIADWDVQWFWPGREHVDPVKEAVAQDKRLTNGSTTYAREYARDGLDWETEFAQAAREKERRLELGLDEPPKPETEPAADTEGRSYAAA